ncbi:XRE family transcriptional regulator [Actinomadura sp. ATCC 31491]|uniref:XRE family transcriptional regulator n=1 Tax=Actinomadura luzonensis TaxID=2805427 RepID=A0ABT0FQ52_9ACTN|nr:XRE family transcriptional regulator [Actinomadura luzonensis]MCK2214036.1 XRE family transcriptional regulator [Actinomadura luzonensis]
MEDIRAKRLRRCWTQNELARQLELAADPRTRATLPSRSSIIREVRFHEAGTHQPGPVYAELYRRVWAQNPEPETASPSDLPSDHMALAWTVGRLNLRVDRRTILQLAAAATAGAALDPAQRLMRALGGDHRPDDATIAHLEDRTRGFHRIEEHIPAKSLYPALISHLNEVSTLLESGLPDAHRDRLAVVAGESAILAAWFAWELGDEQMTASHIRLANAAAQHAKDHSIAACMAGYRSYMTSGDGARSTRLVQWGLDRIGAGDPATRAWLLARHAEESALLGEHRDALRSIREAGDVYAGADINARPWTCFLDPGRFASMTLTVYSRLRRHEDSIAAMDEIALHLGPTTEIKKLCVVKAEMALAHYRLGDVTEAVACARSALDATTAMGFPLGWERLDNVAAELKPSRSQIATEFRTEYAATRPSGKQPSPL